MHIGRQIIQQVALELGEPAVERWSFAMGEEEFARLRRHLELGRAHDVTSIITRDEEVAVVRKHGYPPGAYRAPSGGVHPEEAFLDGARREAWEETGLAVELLRYLLRVHATFECGGEQARWTTHVLWARPVGGTLGPVDVAEIEEARWVGWPELLERIGPVLEGSGLGGLAYRARLHETAYRLWRQARAEGEAR